MSTGSLRARLGGGERDAAALQVRVDALQLPRAVVADAHGLHQALPPAQSLPVGHAPGRAATVAVSVSTPLAHAQAQTLCTWAPNGLRTGTGVAPPPPSVPSQAAPHRKAAAQPAAPTHLPAGALPRAPRVEQRRHRAGLPSGGARLVMHRGQAVPERALLQRRIPRGAPVQLPQRDALQAQPPQRAPALRARRGGGLATARAGSAGCAACRRSRQQASRGTALMAFAASLMTCRSGATLAHRPRWCTSERPPVKHTAPAPRASRRAVHARPAGARGAQEGRRGGAHRTALTN